MSEPKLSADIQEQRLLKCIRCGFCQDACPTYRMTLNEAESPRGRIYLARSVAEGELAWDRGAISHLDSCLGCRACEPVCPSGVEYGAILEQARANIEKKARSLLQHFARRILLNLLTTPRWLHLLATGSELKQRALHHPVNLPPIFTWALSGKWGHGPAMPTSHGRAVVPAVSPAIGAKKHRVGLLLGCVMREMFGSTHNATLQVLQWHGCEVIAPPNAGCCGALHMHTGDLEAARMRARRLIDAFQPYNCEVIVVNSAGCGSAMKEYGELLAGDPRYSSLAKEFAMKTRDIHEYLVEIGFTAPTQALGVTVAYHDACHLAHGQNVREQPRQILGAIPGLRLVELPESDTCCGSAGIYNILQPEMARRLLDRKVSFIRSTGATVLATGNPGCIAWIEQGLRELALPIQVVSPVELLADAYCQLPKSQGAAETKL